MAMAKEDASMGRVQLRTESGEVILIPKPSSDPNDPLNWSQPFKYYVAIITCFGMLMCTFLAAGPTVAIVEIATDFGGGSPTSPQFQAVVAQVAFFFTTSALTQGVGTLIWVPFLNKYGRRPCYIISFTMYLLTSVWAGMSTGYTSEIVARILLGFFSGAGECLGPATISDIFFLHERGSMMALYNFSVGSGVSIGIIISAFIVVNNSWRVIYLVGSILIGALLLIIVFTFPETAYNRVYDDGSEEDVILDSMKKQYRLSLSIVLDDQEKARVARHFEENDRANGLEPDEGCAVTKMQKMEERIRRLESVVLGKNQYESINSNQGFGPQKKTYWSTLALFSGEQYTSDSLVRMFCRPFGLILLPPVLWATLVMATTIGFSVAISSAFANDFARVYGFTAFQAGMGFFGSLVGGILAIPAGGPVGEAIANYFTIRNGGVREPEFRLPGMVISMVLAPLGLVLYGAGLQYKLHFMVPIVGIGLGTFSIGQAINISFVYTLDAYGPLSGEVTIAQLAFKSVIGFGLSAATNTWISSAGEFAALSEMAAITGVVLALWVPMFLWGGRIRRWSMGWRCVRFVSWKRE